MQFTKDARQGRIRSLIGEKSLRTQSQIAKVLNKEGYEVTQSSVSRDLEEIGVVKIQGSYALPSSVGSVPKFRLRLIRPAGDALLVLKCEPGFASAMSAEIDTMNLPGVVGTLAGDDTIFIAVNGRPYLMGVPRNPATILSYLKNGALDMNATNTPKKIKKIVLAYSGGLDTSAMLLWLKERYQCEVVCFCADVGQGAELSGLEEKAAKTGASKTFVMDLREEFVKEYVWSAVKANAIYEGVYLMGTSLARPVIAKKQIEIAREVGADAVAHGATGKGNDQVRFELTYYALNPKIEVIAPWRDWEFKGRSDLINYCAQHKIPVQATASKPYSMDANLMHVSYEGGILEDPWAAPPEDIFKLTVNPEKAPDTAELLEIDFVNGEPSAVNGKKLDAVALLTELNRIGGAHGIGRVDVVENRYVGMKSRGVYETPGVTLLQAAHRAVESITMDREVMRLRDTLAVKFSEMIYYGYWFSPEGEILRKTIDATQQGITGTAKLKLFKGGVQVLGRKAPKSLYNMELVTFEADNVYSQKDAEGFIKLNALRLRMNQARNQ